MEKRIYYILIVLLIAVLLFTRLYGLTTMRPLHHDEGVNGWFMNNLFYKGQYQYNPSNYHGPFFYFISLPAFYIFGSNIFSLRITVALFGILMFLLFFLLKKKYDKMGFLIVLTFFVFSISIIYYSRYAIHETFFIFFTLASYIFLVYFLDEKKPEYLYLAAASLAFMFTIKETAYITAFIFLTYFLIADIYNYKKKKESFYFKLIKENSKPFFISILIFLIIIFIFYSNFFHNLSGSFDIVKSLCYWTPTGTGSDILKKIMPFCENTLEKTKAAHEKPFYYFLLLLLRYELPILIFSIFGLIYCLWKKENLILVWWAILTVIIYSLVPYKTPWLLPNLVLPLILLSGYGVIMFYKNKISGVLLFILLLVSMPFLSYHIVYINFIYPESDSENKFAYAHTTNDIKWVMQNIKTSDYTKVAMIGENGESYWPFPFYLQNYSISYGNPSQFQNITEKEILIMFKKFKNEIPNSTLEIYNEYDFQLRPGVWAKLFIKKK